MNCHLALKLKLQGLRDRRATIASATLSGSASPRRFTKAQPH